MHYIIIGLLVAILASLGSALYYLVHDRGSTDRTLRALTWRIGLSIGLFLLIVLSYRMGWVSGHLLG